MKKQTAVEFLLDKYKSQNNLLFAEDWEQAKQIESDQIIEAFYQGVDQDPDCHSTTTIIKRKYAEHYYCETYVKK